MLPSRGAAGMIRAEASQHAAHLPTRPYASAARTRDDLLAATGAALDAVTAADAAGCYADCGFPLPPQLR
jgi:hypothetical protein